MIYKVLEDYQFTVGTTYSVTSLWATALKIDPLVVFENEWNFPVTGSEWHMSHISAMFLFIKDKAHVEQLLFSGTHVPFTKCTRSVMAFLWITSSAAKFRPTQERNLLQAKENIKFISAGILGPGILDVAILCASVCHVILRPSNLAPWGRTLGSRRLNLGGRAAGFGQNEAGLL